ncbi:MAG: SRPBCC family protein [Flavobacteriales bacterium]|nr:SRPBCC family protein [Flavobacteriales bacterium]
MQYTLEITLDLPKGKVINLFDNPHNLKHWQPGFQELLPIEGKPGEVGAKSRLTYINGNKRIELIETIIQRDLPHSFCASYETNGVLNRIDNQFHEVNGRTTWIAHNEFRFSGIMKLFAWSMTGIFKKQSLQFMQNFKRFAEEGKSVSV